MIRPGTYKVGGVTVVVSSALWSGNSYIEAGGQRLEFNENGFPIERPSAEERRQEKSKDK